MSGQFVVNFWYREAEQLALASASAFSVRSLLQHTLLVQMSGEDRVTCGFHELNESSFDENILSTNAGMILPCK